MSQENLELAEALFPDDTDVVWLIRDEEAFSRLSELIGPLFTDDFESVMAWPAVNRTYPGLEGLRKNWLDWLEPWATYRSTIEELIDVGDHVVALLRDYGRRKDMETEVEVICATTLTFREGKVARWGDYADRAEAFKAAGLSEQGAHADS